MLNRRIYLGGIGLVALLLLVAARQPALAPAALMPLTSAPATAVAGAAGVAIVVSATPVTELPTPFPIATSIASPTPAPAGTLASLAQAMLQASNQLRAVAGAQPTAAQMEQAMDHLATTSGQLAPLAVQARQGTPDLRQMVALTLSQTALLAAELRDEATALSPEQRMLAVRQMQVLSLDVAQAISEVQDANPQSSLDRRQNLMARMQHLLGAKRSIEDRYRVH